jgi:hypothetical protein
MSIETKPSDTVYLIGYNEYSNRERAIVIAPNPIRATEIAKRQLPPEIATNVRVLGELRDRIKTAEETGLSFL